MTYTWKPINNQKEAYDCVIVFVNNECPKTSKPKRGHCFGSSKKANPNTYK